MSSSEKSYGSPETRERILDAATRLAAELGPAMRLADVANEAGVSHQALYLHFGGRDGLLLAMLPHMVSRFELREQHEKAKDASDGTTAMKRMIDFLDALNARLDSVGWVLEEAARVDDSFSLELQKRVTGIRHIIKTEVIARLQADHALRAGWTLDDATDLMMSLTTLGTWRELTRELGWSQKKYRARTFLLLKRSLLKGQS